jgi:hypothetical protein
MHNDMAFSALVYSTVLGFFCGLFIYLRGFNKLIEFINWEVVRIGSDFFFIVF